MDDPLDPAALTDIVASWLAEDLGTGDLTATAVVPRDTTAQARIMAKIEGVMAGMAVAEAIFRHCDASVEFTAHLADGESFVAGAELITLSGTAHGLLAGERTALNVLGHLCGIATLTRRYRTAIGRRPTLLLDTRKTLPGLRTLAKAAVRAGGGVNQRRGLDDAILVKENHLIAVGAKGDRQRFIAAVAAALHAGRQQAVAVEIEVESLLELEWALEAGARSILLDNMDPATLRIAVERARAIAADTQLEASGGVNLTTIAAIADSGVDRISVGALTHSVTAIDLSMRLLP
jgi:nicotinate-nucleotide pyrophosphorylase (carboxylating)